MEMYERAKKQNWEVTNQHLPLCSEECASGGLFLFLLCYYLQD